MGFLCWLIGHKHDEDWIPEDTLFVYQERNAVLHGKKIGTVQAGFKVLFCKRCDAVFHDKEVIEKFDKKFLNGEKHEA